MYTEAIAIESGVVCPAPRQGRVLIVDDDAAAREQVANYLTLNDFRVFSAENGRRMMEILRDEPVDLVALELTLRGEDGYQLASRLRETSKVPLIMVTSQYCRGGGSSDGSRTWRGRLRH